KGIVELPLDAITTQTEEGKQVLASAQQLLINLGRGDSKVITTADTADTVHIFSKTVFNGDGIIPPESAEADADTAQALRDIMSCMGSVKDLSGLEGVDGPRLSQFFSET